MINLLPPNSKREIRAGRINTILVRYIFMTVSALVLVAVISAGAYVVMTMERSSAQKTHSENQTEINKYSSITKDIEEYKTNLSVAKSILSKKVNYSELILKIASSIPKGVVLDKLDLDSKTLNNPTTLSFSAINEETVIKLKSALQGRPDLYSDVKIEDIGRGSGSGSGDSTNSSGAAPSSKYPVRATVSLVIKSPEVKK